MIPHDIHCFSICRCHQLSFGIIAVRYLSRLKGGCLPKAGKNELDSPYRSGNCRKIISVRKCSHLFSSVRFFSKTTLIGELTPDARTVYTFALCSDVLCNGIKKVINESPWRIKTERHLIVQTFACLVSSNSYESSLQMKGRGSRCAERAVEEST